MKKICAMLLLTVLLLCLTTAASAQTSGAVATQNNIIQTLGAEKNLKTFTGALEKSGMRDTLATGGPYTIFAPTDDAFNRVPANTLNTIMADQTRTTGLIRNHIVQGRYDIKDLANMGYVTTLDGKTLQITSAGTAFAVDGAHIIKQDIPAGNGIIHVVDMVMVPK